MSKRCLVTFLGAVVVIGGALAQVPPKYKIVTIDSDPMYNYTARMNNRGQIVFDIWQDYGNTDAIDIVLYDNGQYIRLTDDDVYDRQPDINDDGTIVWSRAVDGPGTHPQIVIWRDAVLTQLTNSTYDELDPRINNLGHVVWSRWIDHYRAQVFYYDGQTIRQITNDEWSNQSAAINDNDWIVWTQFDFYQNPWDGKIMVWRSGETAQLSPAGVYEPRYPQINDSNQVVWTYQSGPGQQGIQLWDAGVTTTLTTWGSAGAVNNHGDIALWRFYEGGPVGAYEVWLYRNRQFLQITSDPHNQGWNNVWNVPTDINDRGEIPFGSGRPWWYEKVIKCLTLRSAGEHADGSVKAISATRIDP